MSGTPPGWARYLERRKRRGMLNSGGGGDITAEIPRSTLLVDLMGYWNLNEGGGSSTWRDSLGDHNLLANANLNSNAGIYGPAAEFNGNVDFGDGPQGNFLVHGFALGYPPNGQVWPSWTGDETWAIWIYPTSAQAGTIMVKLVNPHVNQTGTRLTFTAARKIHFEKDMTGSTMVLESTAAVTLNQWGLIRAWSINNGSDCRLRLQINNGSIEEFVSDPDIGLDIAPNTLSIGGFPSLSPLPNSFFGRIDEAGVWRRALSQAEGDELWDIGDANTHPFNRLQYSLQGAWHLDETTGTRVDSHRFAQHLDVLSQPLSGPGKKGNALHCAFPGGVYARRNGSPRLGGTGTGMTFLIWMNVTGPVTSGVVNEQYLAIKGYGLPQWSLAWTLTTRKFIFAMRRLTSDSFTIVSADNFGVLTTPNVWNHVIAAYDRVNGKIKIRVNLGPWNEANLAAGSESSGTDFTIGPNNAQDNAIQYRLDEASYYRRLLSEAECAAHYNVTFGRFYPFVDSVASGGSSGATVVRKNVDRIVQPIDVPFIDTSNAVLVNTAGEPLVKYI